MTFDTINTILNHIVGTEVLDASGLDEMDIDRDGDVDILDGLSALLGLPEVHIDTSGETIKSKTEGYIEGTVSVVPGRSIKTGYLLNGLENFKMEIRGRGNSTWGLMPKKPYQMKFEKKPRVGDDTKFTKMDDVSFLGMPNERKWAFLAEYADKTMLRNTIALEMGYVSSLDWSPLGEFAEVYINDTYQGTYNITEKVEENSSRVDIGDNGYLVEIDTHAGPGSYRDLDGDAGTYAVFDLRQSPGDSTGEVRTGPLANGQYAVIKEPAMDDIFDEDGSGAAYDTAQKIVSFVTAFEDVLFGQNFTDPSTGYAKYVDMDSFVDWFLINEITKNQDSKNYSSIYFNVIFDGSGQGIMNMGPIWDFDLSFGNVNYSDAQYHDGWWVKDNPWVSQMMKDPVFETRVQAKFAQYYAEKDTILEKIDKYSKKLEGSAVRNDDKWAPYLGSYVWPNRNEGDVATGNTGLAGYRDAVGYMKTWYTNRMEWLNSQSEMNENVVFIMNEAFGGASRDLYNLYTFSSGAESWAGWKYDGAAAGVFPLSFGSGGSITVTASVPSGGSANLHFHLEYQNHPNHDPGYNPEYEINDISISGSVSTEYTVAIPVKYTNTYSSVAVYIKERDVTVSITNVTWVTSATTDSS